MARSRRDRKSLMADINVVPYIDVMLVLLVIFMITAPLLTQGVRVDLPSAQAKSLTSKQKEPIIVSVDSRGRYYLNINRNPDAVVTPQFLVNRVGAQLKLDKQSKINRQVLVKGDKSVGYGSVVRAMALLQAAGAGQIGLITQPGAMNGHRYAKSK